MRIKDLRALRQRKERERTGLFLAVGTRIVGEALALGAPIELLVAAPELLRGQFASGVLDRAGRAGVPTLELTVAAMASLVENDGRHGLAAVVRQRWTPLESLRPGAEECWVALDAVQYPGNLGAVLRTAEAVGAAGLILLEQTADPHDPAAVRASMGALFAQRLVRTRFAELSVWAMRHGAALIGSSPSAGLDYRAATYPRRLVLLLGGEAHGLSPGQLAACDRVVRIPMAGRGDSLNLAVAAGLLLYEVYRRRPSS
ncbi:MAG TPA: RNA methyltransferase [Chloroflexota bacterium]|jgi:TrmH family RNA methyltransferase